MELNLKAYYEPVEDNPYLKKFYKNPKKYAFGMQVFLMHRRYRMQKAAAFSVGLNSKYNGAILDRGIPGDKVFAEIHYDDGNINELDYKVAYTDAYETMTLSLAPPSLLIYLRTDPEICFKRAMKRARDQEMVVPTDEFRVYLRRLHPYYEKLVQDVKSGKHVWSTRMEVMEIDWNKEFSPFRHPLEMIARFKPVCKEIKKRLNL